MKITIISLCKYKISEEEFVKPLVEIFKKFEEVEVTHYKDGKPKGDLIILSGTAIKDFEYLYHLQKFEWLRKTNKKVIGICAGAQVISLLFGGKLKKKEMIGLYDVNSIYGKFKAYFLITRMPVLNENFEVLGYSNGEPAIFKVKNKDIYGFTFHPEVMNKNLFFKI